VIGPIPQGAASAFSVATSSRVSGAWEGTLAVAAKSTPGKNSALLAIVTSIMRRASAAWSRQKWRPGITEGFQLSVIVLRL
jgi:hypothetical protein